MVVECLIRLYARNKENEPCSSHQHNFLPTEVTQKSPPKAGFIEKQKRTFFFDGLPCRKNKEWCLYYEPVTLQKDIFKTSD